MSRARERRRHQSNPMRLGLSRRRLNNPTNRRIWTTSVGGRRLVQTTPYRQQSFVRAAKRTAFRCPYQKFLLNEVRSWWRRTRVFQWRRRPAVRKLVVRRPQPLPKCRETTRGFSRRSSASRDPRRSQKTARITGPWIERQLCRDEKAGRAFALGIFEFSADRTYRENSRDPKAGFHEGEEALALW